MIIRVDHLIHEYSDNEQFMYPSSRFVRERQVFLDLAKQHELSAEISDVPRDAIAVVEGDEISIIRFLKELAGTGIVGVHVWVPMATDEEDHRQRIRSSIGDADSGIRVSGHYFPPR